MESYNGTRRDPETVVHEVMQHPGELFIKVSYEGAVPIPRGFGIVSNNPEARVVRDGLSYNVDKKRHYDVHGSRVTPHSSRAVHVKLGDGLDVLVGEAANDLLARNTDFTRRVAKFIK